MASAEYKRLLTQAYDIDKPDAPPDELAFYRRHIVCRYWEPDELRGLMEATGFVGVDATRAFTSLPLDGDETRVSFVAVKPGPTHLA